MRIIGLTRKNTAIRNKNRRMEADMKNSPLLEQVRFAIRVRHYSYRTEQTHIQRIKRFILFQNERSSNRHG
jgi:hypothetical protein